MARWMVVLPFPVFLYLFLTAASGYSFFKELELEAKVSFEAIGPAGTENGVSGCWLFLFSPDGAEPERSHGSEDPPLEKPPLKKS